MGEDFTKIVSNASISARVKQAVVLLVTIVVAMILSTVLN